jgi:hypothetical protein
MLIVVWFPYDPSFIGRPGCVNLASHLFLKESFPRSLILNICIGSFPNILGIGNQGSPYDPSFLGTSGCVNLASHLFLKESFPRSLKSNTINILVLDLFQFLGNQGEHKER